MSANGFDAFDHATQTAHAWLAQVIRQLGTDDRHLAYRALRAWLHTLRDRLPVETAAAFAAQLPELLRGVYYDGWQPSKAPEKYGPDEYRLRFAQEAAIRVEDVPATAGAVTEALRTRLSPGQLDQALAQLPQHVRALVLGASPPPAVPAATGPARTHDDRIDRMETQVRTLIEAVRTLAYGLEQTPYDQPGSERGSQAARRAHELLLTAPMAPPGQRP